MLLSSARLRAKLSPLTTAAAVAVVLTLTLAACGGGGGGGGGSNVAAPTPVPPPVNYRTAEFNRNYGLGAIGADAAYQAGAFGQGVTVALLDTGVRRTHNDLAANIVGGLGLLINPAGTITTNATDSEGMGTYAAGIIGGARDGDRFHGVAPSVKIMPLAPDFRGDERNSQASFAHLFRYATTNNVHILHNSFNIQPIDLVVGDYSDGVNARREGVSVQLPGLEVYLSSPFGAEMRSYMSSVTEPLQGRDIAVVTPADSGGWHSGNVYTQNFGISVTPEDIIRNLEITAIVSVQFDGDTTTTVSVSAFRLFYPLTFTVDGSQTVVRADANSPGGFALAPIYRPELRANWLAVAAVNNSMSISRYSGGCGHRSKYWCLTAPGGADNTGGVDSGITSAAVGSDTGITNRAQSTGNETQAAAAHVSGALALLKSRFPNMPMSVLVHILLNTATDLGAQGIDDVYGHGLLNVARAVRAQGNANFVLPPLPTLAPQIPGPPPSDGRDYRNDEFNRNWGLGAINADAAYQRGYWGQGVTVAVVDSGALASHNDLSANIVTGRRFNRAGDALTSYAGEDPSGHGTHVAGVIGGARDGSRFHGVAPSVRIMPLRIAADSAGNELNGNVAAAFRYAMDNNVRILNNGWNDEGLTLRGTYYDSEDARFTQTHDILMPWTEAALALPFSTAASVRFSISAAASAIGDDDVAVVFGAGDRQWNGLSYIRLCGGILSADECTDHRDNFFKRSYDIVRRFQVSWIVGVPVLQHKRVSITMYNLFTVTVDGRQTVLRWEASSPAAYGLAPIYHPTVRGRWIAAVGVERNNNTLRIANSSNGCGDKAKYWCIAAPGANITSAYNNSDTAERELGGTPMAAAHVSGALALLKSRFPDVPMSVLVAILFNTAKDIGEPGADAVYGHGLLDISAAITVTDESLIALPTLWPLNPFDTRNCPGCRHGEFAINYGLGTINADAAYYRNYWGQGVTVAVVDSGVRGSHVNLSANVLHNLARRFDSAGNALTQGALDDPVTTRGGSYIGSHGTGVAGVIAGVRGNNADERPGDQLNHTYGHGVAPSASILPLRFSENNLVTVNRIWGKVTTFPLRGNEDAAFRYAVNNNVQIINNSWGSGFTYAGHYGGNTATTLAFSAPILPQLFQVPGLLDDFRRNIETKANIFRNEDVAVVWAAGNDYWNSEAVCRSFFRGECIDAFEVPNYTELPPTPRKNADYTPAQLISNFVAVEVINGNTVSIALSGGSRVSVNGNVVTISAFEADGVGDYPLAPMFYPSLRGKWLAVVATDSRNRIAWFSNGCGSVAKHWCLAAPGVDISTAHAGHDREHYRPNGTSFSAPHVSGALALLKSRLREMPMSVLIAILLSTATDLGAAGVDDVYGHGLVNVSAAITAQNGAQVVTRNSGVLLRDAKAQLPPSFAAFAQRVGEVRAAVRYLDGFYYDAPLKNLLQTNKAKNTPLNFAAEVFPRPGPLPRAKEGVKNGAFAFAEDGELREVGLRAGMFQVRHNWHSAPSLWNRVGGVSARPFYANDKGNSGEMRFNFGAHLAMFAARGKEDTSRYRQFGLLWRRDFSQTGMALSFSRIDEDDTLLGGKFGGAMPLTGGGRTTQTDIAAYYKLGASEVWRAYANYRRADINASIGGIVHKLSNAHAEGWQLGLSAQDWFSHGDAFRIGIGRDIALSGGKAILRYAKSANPQTDANTQITHNRGYRTEEKHIDLAEDSPLSFALGYGFKPNENSRLSFGANIRRDASSSFSIDWRWNL